MNYGRKGIKKQQMALNAKGPKWGHKLLFICAVFMIVGVVAVGILGASMGIGAFKGILATAPDPASLSVAPSGKSSFVYDIEGNQIGKLVTANSNRIPVTSEQIPQTLKDAFVAIEDQRFYQHNGIDFQSIFHAAYDVVRNRSLGGAGGSTITQQLLKNNVFVDWMEEDNAIQKVKRKIQEQYCAVMIEKSLTKDEILTYYLNTINLSQNCLGVEAASRRYFGKHVEELTLAECAVIASITNKPTRYNPILHPDANRNRMETVLDKMVELGYITQAEEDEALKEDVYGHIMANNEVELEKGEVDSYFVDAIKAQLKKDLMAAGYTENQTFELMYSSGLRINSTMDPKIQAICDEEFMNPDNYPENTKYYLSACDITTEKPDGTQTNYSAEMLAKWKKQTSAKYARLYKDPEAPYEDIEAFKAETFEEGEEVILENIEITPQPQVSFVVIEQSTGYCVAMVGGRGQKEKSLSLNRATSSARQPGSCFKVLAAFGPAIDAIGKTPSSVYLDAPFAYKDGTPVRNWYGEDTYRGIQSIRRGIADSLNIVAVKTITELTPEVSYYSYLQNMGFTSLTDHLEMADGIHTDVGQPLALGGLTSGVYNYELTAAYAAIANGGVYVEPKLYTQVLDSEGNVILDNSAPVTRRVFSEETAYMLTDCMKDTVRSGSATEIRLPNMTVAGKTGTTTDSKDIWIAAYTPYYTAACWAGYDHPTEMNSAELKVPKQMWKAVMSRVHEDLPDLDFPAPSTIVRCEICTKSGKLPRPGVCDGCTKTEIFTRDTVPTEYCDVHYVGPVCGYDNLRATDLCPFRYDGIALLNPIEDESLAQGSSIIASELDPLATGAGAHQNFTGYCHHTEAFFLQENWEAILAAEQAEYAQRVAAAQAAAEAAANQNP